MGSVPEEYVLPSDDDKLLEECKVTAFRSSGPGGQHKNKSNTAIRLFHRPSGVVAIGKRERSQRRNLTHALERLRIKLEGLLKKPAIRRATKLPRKAKEKRMEDKRLRSQIKRRRGKVSEGD